MSIRVIKCEKPNALFCRYDRQTSAQDCYIELDCKAGTLLATYNAEIGNAVPFSVWHGHEQRFGIPCLTNDAANKLMDELVPLAERVVAGYESVWNGNNNVAKFSDDAQNALEEIGSTCDVLEADDGGGIIEWAVEDWLDNVIFRFDEDGAPCKWNGCVRTEIQDVGTITGTTTDEELDVMEEKIKKDIEENMVLTGVSKFLEEERGNCKQRGMSMTSEGTVYIPLQEFWTFVAQYNDTTMAQVTYGVPRVNDTNGDKSTLRLLRRGIRLIGR